jgi:hypothetical protein
MRTPTSTIYRILAMAGLALVFFAYSERMIPMTVVVVVGLAVLFMPRFLGAGVFLVTLAVLELLSMRIWPRFRLMHSMFDLSEMMFAAGTLLYVGSLYRVHSFVLAASNFDARLAEKTSRPLPPQTRPESSLTREELVGWLVSAPMFVLAAEVLRRLLSQPSPVDELVPARVAHIVIAIWALVMGVLFVWTFFDYWRRVSAGPEQARMYLENMVWLESRRDQGRIGRWLAWQKRRKARSVAD